MIKNDKKHKKNSKKWGTRYIILEICTSSSINVNDSTVATKKKLLIKKKPVSSCWKKEKNNLSEKNKQLKRMLDRAMTTKEKVKR